MAGSRSCFDLLGLRQYPDLLLEGVVLEEGGKLGEGAFATVHEAQWQGVRVAVKVLHKIFTDVDVVGDGGRALKLREFGGEVDRLRQLHHPNLTQMLGVSLIDNVPGLVIELMSHTLLECSVGAGRQSDVTLLGYLSDTAAGLRYLRARRLIHRDLSPKNVLIRNGCAKLSDFGVAKFIQPGDLRHHLNRSAAMTPGPGTILYMPPEALLVMVENAEYDETLDIFSFGVLGICVLTGSEPSPDLLYTERTERIIRCRCGGAASHSGDCASSW